MTLHKIKNFSKIVLIFVFGGLVIVPISHAGAVQVAPGGGGNTTTPTPTPTPGLTGCGTNAKPAPGGVNCVPTTTDPALIQTDTNSTLIDRYLNPLIKLLSVLVGVAVTFGVIYGGIEYSMSAGDPQKASNGRKHIRNAVIALVAYALALGFLNFIIPGGITV